MAETIRTFSAILALLADNSTLDVSAQDVRDWLHSSMGVNPSVAKSAAYAATEDDGTIRGDTSGGAFTITLPAVASVRVGKRYTIIKVDSSVNALTVDANAAELINGSADYILDDQWDCVTIENTGTNWVIVSFVAAD